MKIIQPQPALVVIALGLLLTSILQQNAADITTSRYEIIFGNFTWAQAKVDAEARGGHLATITSEQEWNTVVSLFGNNLLGVFLGGTDEQQEGVWKWITGEPWKFENWASGQPDNSSGAQHYLWLHPAYGLKWDDTSDAGPKSNYLLEREPAPQPPVQIEFVTVGDPGNPADSTGYGKVDYVFQIGKFEINNLQYAAFLNAKAKSDPHSLYDPTASPANGIVRSGTEGSFSYSIKSGMERKPVTFVNFYKVMRFSNWLHNGGTAASDTETGAYTFGADGSLPKKRNPGAQYFVPTENEWYKAAYYQPVGAGGPPNNYWLYATRSNVAPVPEPPPGGSNSANYESALPSSTTSAALTDVGAYVSARSYYGTFDQTGNVWEWNETALLGGRSIRGGSPGEPASKINSLFRFDNFNDGAGWEQGCCGFRLARAFPPVEPLTVGQLAAPQINEPGEWRPLAVGQLVASPSTGTGPSSYWEAIPDVLRQSALDFYYLTQDVTKKTAEEFGQIDFQALNSGPVWILVLFRSGNEAAYATLQASGWRVLSQNFETEYGYDSFGQNRNFQTWMLFERICKSGEKFSLRTETYQPPVILRNRPIDSQAPQPPLVNVFTTARLKLSFVQGLRLPLAPPDGSAFRIETSSDLKSWAPLITFPTNSGPFEFIDSSAIPFSNRFYRAVRP